jgi:hypothetical protein
MVPWSPRDADRFRVCVSRCESAGCNCCLFSDVVEHELAHFLRVLPDGMHSKYISCMLAIVVTCTQCNFRWSYRRVIYARILPLRTSPPAPAHAVRASGTLPRVSPVSHFLLFLYVLSMPHGQLPGPRVSWRSCPLSFVLIQMPRGINKGAPPPFWWDRPKREVRQLGGWGVH